MKNKLLLVFISVLSLFLFCKCQEEETRLSDYYVDFATTVIDNSQLIFQLDNGEKLLPQNATNVELKHDTRVILSYTPLENNHIHIRNVRPIFMGAITDGLPNKTAKSPIKIISRWISGPYLNIRLEVDYHSQPHTAKLYRDTLATTPTLYFNYARDEDPPGAPVVTLLSFKLEDPELEQNGFYFWTNTTEGVKKEYIE